MKKRDFQVVANLRIFFLKFFGKNKKVFETQKTLKVYTLKVEKNFNKFYVQLDVL